MNFTFTNFASIDAIAVLDRIDNGEWERAYDRAQVLLTSIEMAMEELGIKPTPIYINDTTPVA